MANWLKNFFRWAKGIFFWLQEPIRLYWNVVCFFLVFDYGTLIPTIFDAPWDERIRLAGLFYQLAGIGTVGMGLHETRKLFRRPTLRSLVESFWNRRPRLRPVSVPLSGGHCELSLSDRVTLGLKLPPPDPSLSQEERLQWTIDQLVRLFEAVQTQQRQTQEQFERYGDFLTKERQERQTEDDTIRRLLEEALVGGIRLEAFGVVCLVFGAILSTYPVQIATWMQNWLF
jgi:hypothetical protein